MVFLEVNQRKHSQPPLKSKISIGGNMLNELFGSFAGQLSLAVILFMIVASYVAVKTVLKKINEEPKQ
jgi:hypothetical protein